jgi:uncharacterized protein (TIGR02118 family)
MSAITHVLYPKGTKFNMDYYISKHMKAVGEGLKPHGLKSWQVVQYPEDADFLVGAVLTFESLEAMQKAGSTEPMKEAIADVPNFSDKQPTFLGGTLAGSG